MTVSFKVKADIRNHLKRKAIIKKGYANVYLSLPPESYLKLQKCAEKAKIRESYVLRDMLDKYCEKIDKGEITLYFSGQRTSKPGNCLRHKSRTIWKRQDDKLRELYEKSGVSMSEMMRQAIDTF